MKKIPLGLQSFRKIIEGGYVYVDKTQYIYKLINGASYNFLSRPRRFGKSLLLDTIAEVFKGEKELFKGQWIYDSDYAFDKHPVIRLDMSSISTKNPEVLESSIISLLKQRITEEGLDIDEEIPSDMFARLIVGLNKKYNQSVVVLIDEYDKPILDHLDEVKTAEANRKVIRGFYGILKSMDPHLKFTFITGVSKFTKTAIFSELNNLNDITMTEKYAGICGVAVHELDRYFGEHMANLKNKKKFQHIKNMQNEILAWYDGYSWDGESKFINPFSLLSFFEQEKFGCFWYSSGSPKFLIDMIKNKPESYLTLANLKINERLLDSFNIEKMEIAPLLFQTGYLTVKEVIEVIGPPTYVLQIPNYEVREAFSMQIVSSLTESSEVVANNLQMEIRDALLLGNLDTILYSLRRLFASIPYNLHVDLEAYYYSIFYPIMTVLGFDVEIEVSVSGGRVDAALELDDKVYVMEFKYVNCEHDASAEHKQSLFGKALEEAMGQIKENGYYKKFINSGKTILLAAFTFLGRDNIEMRAEVFV